MSHTFALSDTCPVSNQTFLEDRICTYIQIAGLILSIGGVATLISLAGVFGDAWQIVSMSIYGATLVIAYLSSVMYHASKNSSRKRVFKVLDHANIHLLIAGTYTPYTLVTLNGGWGWSLFGVVWGIAAVGYGLKVVFKDRYGSISVALYLMMGWCIIIATGPLVENLPVAGFVLLVTGGVVYSLGVFFYLFERMRFNHAVWQIFVLAGSACFYFSILFFVLF